MFYQTDMRQNNVRGSRISHSRIYCLTFQNVVLSINNSLVTVDSLGTLVLI